MPRLVVATGNPGKLREIRDLLRGVRAEVVGLGDFPDLRMPEEGDVYEENAVAKARSAALATGCVAVGDDSGLEVEGLGGRPGPHSARYGGPALDDAGRVAHLLREMEGLEGPKRRARFVCVAALASPEGTSEIAHGRCEGEILLAPEGEGGFGYDPVFFSASEGCSMARVPDARKNEISHRALAFRALRASLEATLARFAAG